MVLKLDNLRIGSHISEAAFVQYLNDDYNKSVKKLAHGGKENACDLFCEISLAKDLDHYPKWSILDLPEQTQSRSLIKLIEAIIRSSVSASAMFEPDHTQARRGAPIMFTRRRSLSDPNLTELDSPLLSRRKSQSDSSLDTTSSQESDQSKDYCFKL